ncbi:MAG: hypothetical protein H0U57_04685 [Tatlockia sp.]|nr:hypothetical protein [Tatlockia sp.]
MPCKANIVSELEELLELIESHNTPNKKLIDSDLIENCLEAYQHYLNTSSLDEHKKNVRYLLLRWIGPYINREMSFFLFPSQDENELVDQPFSKGEPPNTEKIGLSIINFLDSLNQNSFEELRNESFNFFESLKEFPQLKKNLIYELIKLTPETTTDSFNQIFNLYPISAYGGLFASGLFILTLCEMLAPKEATYLIAAGLVLYGPSLAEKGYTLISKHFNHEDKVSFNNVKLAEIRSKNRNLFMFPIAENENNKKESILQGNNILVTFGK